MYFWNKEKSVVCFEMKQIMNNEIILYVCVSVRARVCVYVCVLLLFSGIQRSD